MSKTAETIATIAAVEAAISLVETLVPKVAAAFRKGEVTVEEQAALSARIDLIRSGEAFKPSHWRPATASAPSTETNSSPDAQPN